MLVFGLLIVLFYFFSDVGFKTLKTVASDSMFNLRTLRGTPSDTFLVPKGIGAWGNKAVINKDSITLAMADVKVKKKCHDSDERLMNAFLENTRKNTVTLPEIAPVIEFIPTGAPIIDFLRAYKDETSTWDYPSTRSLENWLENRTIHADCMTGVEVREIFVGTSTKQEVDELVTWFNTQYTKSQKEFPSGVVSFDVEMVNVSTQDMKRIADPDRIHPEIKLAKHLDSKHPKDSK